LKNSTFSRVINCWISTTKHLHYQ